MPLCLCLHLIPTSFLLSPFSTSLHPSLCSSYIYLHFFVCFHLFISSFAAVPLSFLIFNLFTHPFISVSYPFISTSLLYPSIHPSLPPSIQLHRNTLHTSRGSRSLPPPSASTSSLHPLPSSSSSSYLRRLCLPPPPFLPPSLLHCLILWRNFTSAALPLFPR